MGMGLMGIRSTPMMVQDTGEYLDATCSLRDFTSVVQEKGRGHAGGLSRGRDSPKSAKCTQYCWTSHMDGGTLAVPACAWCVRGGWALWKPQQSTTVRNDKLHTPAAGCRTQVNDRVGRGQEVELLVQLDELEGGAGTVALRGEGVRTGGLGGGAWWKQSVVPLEIGGCFGKTDGRPNSAPAIVRMWSIQKETCINRRAVRRGKGAASGQG